MEGNIWEFSLDAKRVDEKELRSPTLFPVSIIASTVHLANDITDLVAIREEIHRNILKKFPFQRNTIRLYKEGFLEFVNQSDNELICFYAKETPTKIMYEADDLKIHSARFSLLNPAYTVRIKVIIGMKNIRLIMFGGSETLISKAIGRMYSCIINSLAGGHNIVDTTFNKEEMNNILKKFGTNVEYIWIHPGESKKFIKFAENKEGDKISKIPEYIVHAKLHGFHITGSPITLSLIEESGVYLKEIQGRLLFGLKKDITSRVSSDGKAIFFIPETIVPSGNSAYEVAESLYEKLIVPISNVNGSRQTTMGDF